MPSSPGYKRNYKQEAAAEDSERREQRRLRNKARRAAIKRGVVKRNDGKDLDHKKPLSQGGSNSPSNLRAKSPSANRSYKRTSSGAIAKRGKRGK